MNLIVHDIEKRAQNAALQLLDMGLDSVLEDAREMQRNMEHDGMSYAHATLKVAEFMEKVLEDA